VVELVAVGIVDLVLILAMFHPAITRSFFASMPMTAKLLAKTISTATSGGGA